MNQILIIVLSLVSFSAIAGDPIPGIGITVEQAPNGVVGTGTTNSAGEFTLSNLSAGDYQISLSGNSKTIVVGKQQEDRITISSGRSAALKPIRLELSRYQDGDDLILKKRPGRSSVNAVGSTGTATRATDYNSSRSNRTTAARGDLDADDDGDSVPTQARGATRSPKRDEVAPTAVDNDCSGIAEIITTEDSLTVRISCDIE